MRKKYNENNFIIVIVIKLIFVVALVALILYLIIPKTSFYYMNGTFQPFFNRLNERDLIMIPGDRFKLRVERLNTRVTFSSLDIKVAEVTSIGTIIAFRPGKTFITAEYNDKQLRCRVRVIRLNKKKIDLNKGDKFDLDIEGPLIFNKTKWSSSNSKIAKVNRFGKVEGVSKGNAIIRAEIDKNILRCEVTVK